MRNRNTPASPGAKEGGFDHNVDRYPAAAKGLRRILDEGTLPDGPIERLEVTFLASGEATYRVWEPRAEDSEGGYLAPE